MYRCRTTGPWPLIPTDAGLWTMDADGKLSRVTLDPKKPNVHVSILRWPKRPGKMHVGVAPQDGGRIYELDVKTRKVALTAGYCGTLLTPMAANFNIVPAAILETRSKYRVILS